jgi:mannose-6-phosphate isomerase
MIADFFRKPDLIELEGVVRHYDWGGLSYLPELLNQSNPELKPFAELWMGAHPSAPARARNLQIDLTLDRLIATAGEVMIGPEVLAGFQGKLPYLFKVLDARQMLSIQAHPTLAQARDGFARENAAGVPLASPQRNYRDDQHKPEVHVALTEFWMLHGFRPLTEILAFLERVPELRFLMPKAQGRLSEPVSRVIREIYQTLMALPQARVDRILGLLIDRLGPAGAADKHTPEFWIQKAAAEFARPDGSFDRGLFSFYLLNLVHLAPGEGTYQPAGMLHAYLEGTNVELMANSDNVLRGGLTTKNVDVDELLRILSFDGGVAEVIFGEAISETETVYRTAAKEFELSCIHLQPGQSYQAGPNHGPQILILLNGETQIAGAGSERTLQRGCVMMVPHVVPYKLGPAETSAVLFKAGVPTQR